VFHFFEAPEKKNRRSERWRISPTARKRWTSDGQATSWRKIENFKPPFSLTECPKSEARGKQRRTSTIPKLQTRRNLPRAAVTSLSNTSDLTYQPLQQDEVDNVDTDDGPT